MRRLALLAFLLATRTVAAAGDPSGTVSLQLEVGETAPVTAKPGANVLCDDPRIAAGEFTADGNGFVIRGLHPGSTLCGVWLAGQTPGGLYRVQVVAKKSDEKTDGPQQAGSSDAGVPDGGG